MIMQPRRMRMMSTVPMAMPILAPRVRGPVGGLKVEAMMEDSGSGDVILMGEPEKKVPESERVEPAAGFCWQPAERAVRSIFI
jgi:hypothetical protein